MSGWEGTDDDGSSALQNTLTMAAKDHSSAVLYGVDQIVVEGACSLAEAIEAANTDSPVGACPAGAGADTLVLTEDQNVTSELPRISTQIAILGAGHSITGAGGTSFRILDVGVSGTLSLDQVWVSNGVGAGILNRGLLTVTGSILSGNDAGTSDGGGLFNDATGFASLVNTTISDNVADGGGGILNDGDSSRSSAARSPTTSRTRITTPTLAAAAASTTGRAAS